jgi:hypothetical protein
MPPDPNSSIPATVTRTTYAKDKQVNDVDVVGKKRIVLM